MTEIDIRPGQTAEQLAERFEVTERTIRRDIQKIQDYGHPVVNERGYRFLTKPFLRPLALTGAEQLAILIALELAATQLDESTHRDLSSVADKIQSDLSTTDRLKSLTIKERASVQMDPETKADIESGCLLPLTEAIDQKRIVTFIYQGRKDPEPRLREMEPLGITFKNKRWYVQAFDPEADKVKSFRFSRLQQLTLTQRVFEDRDNVKAEDADFHEWDIGGEEPIEVEIRCSESLQRWFEENKPHPSVRVNGSDTVNLAVRNLESFLKWFTSLDDAVLTAPPEAITTLRERLARLQELYP